MRSVEADHAGSRKAAVAAVHALGAGAEPLAWPDCAAAAMLLPKGWLRGPAHKIEAAVTALLQHGANVISLRPRAAAPELDTALTSPERLRPNMYPVEELSNTATAAPFTQLTRGTPRITAVQWGWPQAFLTALLNWMAALRWPGKRGTVTFMELAVDFEGWMGK